MNWASIARFRKAIQVKSAKTLLKRLRVPARVATCTDEGERRDLKQRPYFSKRVETTHTHNVPCYPYRHLGLGQCIRL